MCGIVGFIGRKPAAPLLLQGLAKLEYRGYDSAGIALLNKGSTIDLYKAKGRLAILSERINGGKDMTAPLGIGHTRWATHGKPSDENAHPHFSDNQRFAVVHNGIIENYVPLKKMLIAEGYTFRSETDTEVISNLMQREYHGDLLSALQATVKMLEGSYAIGVICVDHPEEMVAVRHDNPLIVGLAEDGNFIASDIPAVLAYTRRVIYIADNDVVRLTADKVEVFDRDHNLVDRPVKTVDWDVESAEKGGYEHFMIKEIMEQPHSLAATIKPRITDAGDIVLDGIHLTAEQLKDIHRIFIVACGSAYHAGVVGKYVMEQVTRIPVEVDIASEFRYRDPLVDEHSLLIIISQSGETADTLAALREAKARGARVMSIVNVVGSSIANESDDVLYTWAGPEISVATTKGYSTQVVMLYLIAFYIAEKIGKMTAAERCELVGEIQKLPQQVECILEQAPAIQKLAKRYASLEHAYFIGRNLDYAVALEASLKLKEVSYIHSEAYAAGELKHGTISLIEEGTMVTALACCDRLVEKTLSNVKEVKARGAQVLLVTTEGESNPMLSEVDHVLYVPKVSPLLMPSLEVIPMQLLGYYISLARGCDIDKPRNLAKSVTVE